MLAVCSHDSTVYVYMVNEDAKKYSRAGRCLGHNSFIKHLDWSDDSQFFRTNGADEVLFCTLKA